MTLTELQSKVGEVSIALIRGEEIIITRNGKDLGRIIPMSVKAPDNNGAGGGAFTIKPVGKLKFIKIKKQDIADGIQLNAEYAKQNEKQNSKYPATYLGKPLSGRHAPCPICYESVPIEFAQQHYQQSHEDI